MKNLFLASACLAVSFFAPHTLVQLSSPAIEAMAQMHKNLGQKD
jgi:hypothetical protein